MKTHSYYWKANYCLVVLFLCFISIQENVAYGKSNTQTQEKEPTKTIKNEGKLKPELKKIVKTLSFKNFFHHSDSTKLATQYIHEQHKLTKGKKNYPYNIKHDSLKLPEVTYRANSDFSLDYEIFGWYPYWEKDLYKSLNYSLLTTIAYFSYSLDPNTGKAKTINDWATTPVIDSAKVHENKVLLTVTNFGETNNKNFLNNNTAINTLISELKTLLANRDANGICLDFEGVANSQKADYAKFIALLSQELKKENSKYLIYITVPAVDWAKSLDFEALIPAVDQFIIMGYGFYGSTSKIAGPGDLLNSGKVWEPYNLTTSVNYYLANAIPSTKLILALPYYGVIWDTETADKGAKVTKFIGNRTYDYIKSKIVAPIQYDSLSQTAWYSYVINDKGTNKFRQCWFDNDSTLSVKLNFIKSKKLKGMGIWALGYDKGFNELWETIAKNMCDTEIRANDGISNNLADSLNNTTDSLSNDSLKTTSTLTSFLDRLTNIEVLIKQIADYKTILLVTMLLVVIYGGAGFIIAMFQPNTRLFFFGNTAYTIYYSCFILLFLLVLLRWVDIINDFSIMLILGFIAGSVSIYLINKIIKRINKDMP